MREIVMSIKDMKAAVKQDLKYKEPHLLVKVYDCDESGTQTYDVEVLVYAEGEGYIDTYVTDTYYEGEAKEAMKRAREVRTALLKDYENIPIVKMYHM
jgi:hypothetical protein